MLHDLIMRHKASLQMFDDICHLVNEYTLSQESSIQKLQSWKSLLRYMEGSHRTHLLWPTNCNVTLHNGKTVTVPVFDMEELLISILTDKTLMSNTNFAEGYNVLTGDVNNNNPCNQKYGEVHTGDAWIPARDSFCTNHPPPTMPVSLIVFGDKPHTNLHGTLALTPIIFTLTLFNRTARNNTRFWRPIGYIPNLLYGEDVADHRKTSDKLQDKHTCISCIFESLHKIAREGGFNLVVLGQNVHVKVWIH
jgi:hypothetical protein